MVLVEIFGDLLLNVIHIHGTHAINLIWQFLNLKIHQICYTVCCSAVPQSVCKPVITHPQAYSGQVALLEFRHNHDYL